MCVATRKGSCAKVLYQRREAVQPPPKLLEHRHGKRLLRVGLPRCLDQHRGPAPGKLLLPLGRLLLP